MLKCSAFALSLMFVVRASSAMADEAGVLPFSPPAIEAPATLLSYWLAQDARQAVAVDQNYFYAINNTAIGKYDKKTGALVLKWSNPDGLPLIHFNSGVVVDGFLYVAHSNYSAQPATSSIEVFDARTLQHLDDLSHSFGIERGSLTWIDRDNRGRWWGGFSNYDKFAKGTVEPYGLKRNTQIVRFAQNWAIEEAFVLPSALLDRFGNMSNSGGSWGPDGKLYITGHDNAEVYALKEPRAGSVMDWISTVPLDISGQGIAWDRTVGEPVLYGLQRSQLSSAPNKITVNHVPAAKKTSANENVPIFGNSGLSRQHNF